MTTEKTQRSRPIRSGLAIAWVLVVGLGSIQADGADKTTLRWKFKPGEVLHYSMEQTTISTGPDRTGREIKRSFTMTTDMTWTTKAIEPSGVANWNQTIDRVRVSVKSPGSSISSDSQEAGNEESLFGPIFKILVGAEFHSKMNPQGDLVEIKLSEKLQATLVADNNGGQKGQFSEDGLKNMLTQMVVPLPEAAVAPGETWSRKLAIPSDVQGENRQIEQIFTYKGAETASKDLDAIDFTTKMEPHKVDPKIPLVYKNETTTGRFDFDNTIGRINRSNSTEVVEVSLTMMGKESLQKVETTRVFSLSKDKAP
jgi:hypothetical protein